MEFSANRSIVQSTANNLRDNAAKTDCLKDFLAALQTWEQLDRPLQTLENYKERDDVEARQLFDQVRDLTLHLAKEHKRFDIALTISKASVAAFSGLPRAKSKIEEDIKAIEDHLATKGADVLARFIEGFGDNLHRLSVSLQEYGFKPNSGGPAGELFSVFVTSVTATRGTSAADLPWLILRNLAIRLNNEAGSPHAALAVVDG